MNERIKKIRKGCEMTQQEFADKIGADRSNIAKYESGKANPSNSVIVSICRTFGVREEWLRTGEGEMYVASTCDRELSEFFAELIADGSDAFRTRFVALLRRIPKEHWDVIRDYVALLVEVPTKEKD